MKLELKRTYHPSGTNGQLLLNGVLVCYTIELPWKENRRQISCIPEGRYEIQKRFTPRFGEHFILRDVPQRDYILLHAANDAIKEIKGCIAPVSKLTGVGKGVRSRMALHKLVELVYPVIEKSRVWLSISG